MLCSRSASCRQPPQSKHLQATFHVACFIRAVLSCLLHWRVLHILEWRCTNSAVAVIKVLQVSSGSCHPCPQPERLQATCWAQLGPFCLPASGAAAPHSAICIASAAAAYSKPWPAIPLLGCASSLPPELLLSLEAELMRRCFSSAPAAPAPLPGLLLMLW